MGIFQKRQTVKRKRRWADKLRQIERILLSMLIVVAGFAALYGLYRLVFLGSAFELEKVVVEGNWKRLSPGEVTVLSGARKGDNLFRMSVSDIYDRLNSGPWVKEAAVRRRLPDTLWIYIEEYDPVAIVSSKGFYYVDADGRVVKRLEAGDDKDMPLITGIKLDESGEGIDGGDGNLMGALEILNLFERSRFGGEQGVAEVHYDELIGYSIVTRREPMQILIGHTNLAGRVKRLDRMIDAIAARQGRIQYMLADEDGRIIVRYRPT